MKIAVIPARGGSKRIPRKNVKTFGGKPMIAWSINAARESQCFDSIIVSTDDKEIADIAQEFGAEVPFMRPANLSDDKANTMAVVIHAINWAKNQGLKPIDVCCIYATAPFMIAQDLIAGLELLRRTGSNYVFPVTTYAFPIQRAVRIGANRQIEMFNPDQFNTRSQDLEEAYHDAGQFYWGTIDAWLDERPVFSSGATPLILPRSRVQDIDTTEDWEQAENMFKTLNSGGCNLTGPE